MKTAKTCERCGVHFVGDDNLCETCRNVYRETRTRERRCANCQKYLKPDDEYCPYCGANVGEKAFEPWHNDIRILYGPPPTPRL